MWREVQFPITWVSSWKHWQSHEIVALHTYLFGSFKIKRQDCLWWLAWVLADRVQIAIKAHIYSMPSEAVEFMKNCPIKRARLSCRAMLQRQVCWDQTKPNQSNPKLALQKWHYTMSISHFWPLPVIFYYLLFLPCPLYCSYHLYLFFQSPLCHCKIVSYASQFNHVNRCCSRAD